MKKRCIALLLAALALSGCGKAGAVGTPNHREESSSVSTTVPTETEPPATVPADGNPEDVTCKGSYTGDVSGAVVATVGESSLTAEELQAWYWAEVARYRMENHEISPDFDRALDTQVCEIDPNVATWQQYFLQKALTSWHNARALILQSGEIAMPTEEAYKPNLKNYDVYLKDIPAVKYLYGFESRYQPNTLHQQYLDSLPEMLETLAKAKGFAGSGELAKEAFGTTEESLLAYAWDYNYAYMYFTGLSYYIEPTEEELENNWQENQGSYGESGSTVDIRHILLVPEELTEEDTVVESVEVAADGTVTCSENLWAICEQQAWEQLEYWQKKTKATEFTFGEIAVKISRDTGTALDGGRYLNIRKGQLAQELDNWCFDAARQVGDTTVIRSPYGVHMLYFAGKTDIAREMCDRDYFRARQEEILLQATDAWPMDVDYSAITLAQAEPVVSGGEILYADIAHERFPEVPLYLQQDYPDTKYGGYKITTNGCGITSLAMLASYMADDELTPPEMCARYGRYSHSNGTDGLIFNYEPAVMGFYLREKTYDPRVAKAALEEGQIVISIQHPGYWTRGGHYIVCEKINEEGLVQVRDSNIYNYGKLHGHKDDLHKWGNITANGSGYWIYEDKITYIPACQRCGTGEAITESLLTDSYTCHKCETALMRRGTYMG